MPLNIPEKQTGDQLAASEFNEVVDYINTLDTELDNAEAAIQGKQDANSALDDVSGVNTGDETTSTIQSKRPLKTVNGDSLEGSGDITTPVTTDASDLTSGTLPDARLSSTVQSSLSLADSALQSVDKNDVGLGNVDNTSDLDKPVSTATQAEIDNKQDTLVSGTNIKTINGESILGSGNITISGGGSTFSVFDLTSDYTLTLADRGKTFINQTANDYEITIPANASVDFAEDFAIACIPTSTGKIKVKGATGVTIQPVQTTTVDRPMSILRFGTDNYISVGVKENYTPEPDIVDLFPTGNAASAGAGEADSTSGWAVLGGTEAITSIANTDVQGGDYTIRVTSSINGYQGCNITLTGLNAVPHIATIRCRRTEGTGRIFNWSGVSSVTYNVDFDSVTNGTWINGTVTFIPTGDVGIRVYSGDNDGTEIGGIEVNEIIINEN